MDIKQLILSDLKPGLQMPDKNTLHVWTFSSDAPDSRYKSLHAHAHDLLNRILSYYTGILKEKLMFGATKYGKPFLLPPSGTAEDEGAVPYFNLSHTKGYIVFIFSSCTPVGIDIESVSRKAYMDRIASRFFLPEDTAHLKTLTGDEKSEYFFRCWTRAESLLKGIGTGLSASLLDKAVKKELPLWNLQSMPAPKGYVCSIAYRRHHLL
ncbi:MAG TPA: hypothetical protein DF613_00405 [Lachnospiraceae bacterium]|nr:hypothetical protein [Lachnospiraceae bacterium]